MGKLLICARVIVELFIKMFIRNGKLSLASIIFVACLLALQRIRSNIYCFIIRDPFDQDSFLLFNKQNKKPQMKIILLSCAST